MALRSAAVAPLLALAACGGAPTVPDPDRILVVPATGAREIATVVHAAPVTVAGEGRAPTLTVEESARINTSEMWSEPIGEDVEEMVIE